MTNRYVTDKEKAGLQRRMGAYLERLAAAGVKRRQVLLTDAELARVKQIVACWRGEACHLSAPEIAASWTLKPG